MTSDLNAVITDFNISRSLVNGTVTMSLKEQRGSIPWTAPELICSGDISRLEEPSEIWDVDDAEENDQPILCTKESDVWAFGLTVMVILIVKICKDLLDSDQIHRQELG